MRYIAAIILEGFYAAIVSEDRSVPLAVHREKRVLDVSPEALARGVRVGMPLAEARTILAADGRFVEWTEESYREAGRRWLEIASEYSDVVEPLRQHEALVDLTGHPRPREAAERLRDALAKAGLNARVGLAASRWVARLAARRGDPLGLAHADAEGYVADLPVSLLPIRPDTARRLLLLGYRTAGEVASLSFETLRGQFGDEAHAIAQAAVGRGDPQVRALFPEACVAARAAFDDPPETRQELDAALDRIAREIGAALKDGDLGGRTVELFLEREDASVERVARTFACTLGCEDDVFVALSMMLPRDPEARIASVRARLPGLRFTCRIQLDLQGGRSRSDQAESVGAALAHVRGTFGEASVRLMSEIRESRRARVRRAYRELNGWAWR